MTPAGRRGRRGWGERGASLIEFALVLPLLLFLLFGLLEASFAFQGRQAVSIAASDAVRLSGVSRSDGAADAAALNALMDRIGDSTAVDVRRVVVFDAQGGSPIPTEACRTGAGDDSCRVFLPADLVSPDTTCAGGWCPHLRRTDHLVGIWVEVHYRGISGYLPFTPTWSHSAIALIEPPIVE